MTVDLKHLTYQQYLDLPEMKARYSIVDGELVMAAAPTPAHQTVVLELSAILNSFVREHRLGRVQEPGMLARQLPDGGKVALPGCGDEPFLVR